MAETVSDNISRNRYELEIDGVIAYVNYTRAGDTVSFDHTEVPSQLAGKGVGSRLARGALELARSAGVKVIPRCGYIAEFIRKHAEYQDLVAD
jgi:predicted GNAT family acetyltransferase